MSAQIMTLPTARPTNILPFPSRVPDVDVFVAGHPVSANHNRKTAGAVTKRGRVQYQSSETLAWRGQVMTAVRNALARRLTAPLAVVVVFINCRSDVDNLLKTTLDGVKDATRINDYHYHPARCLPPCAG